MIKYWVFLCSLSACVLSWGGVSEDNIYGDDLTFQSGSTVVILPPQSRFQDFLGGSEVVFQELEAQLVNLGFNVISYVDKSSYTELLLDVFGGEYVADLKANEAMLSELNLFGDGVELAIKSTEQKSLKVYKYLREKHSASLVIHPSFVMKQAKLKRRKAVWDGVKIRQIVKGPGSRSYQWKGSTKGVSLELDVYTASKEWLLTTYGGVALPFYVDLRDAEMKQVEDLYSNESGVEDGVAASLLPIEEHLVD